ncbi:hypothetical protein GOBAR_DD31198 [Gossypium barbadense]|nr:hypothetical protein GOBAR_DD31198 [Gossypium barbadense]
MSPSSDGVCSVTRLLHCFSASGMEGCFTVSSNRKSGGMTLIWRDGVDVTIQNYSKYHIDSVVCREEGEKIRFTGFYGQTEPSLRNEAWEMLKRAKNKVNEGWIVGGDVNAILNDSEKEGGRRKPRAVMDDFGDILEELSLRDTKTLNGWFPWSNNREGNRLVKERLDRFVILDDIMEKMPLLASYVVHQSKSDHEAIIMDLYGNRPQRKGFNPKACFRYDRCWAKEREARDIISSIWSNEGINLLGKMVLIKERLGPWQYHRYRRMKYKVKSLEKDIERFMNGQ